MNSVTLIGKVEVVSIKDMGSWTRCGVKIKNSKGLDTWFDVQGVKKTGKEIDWLPKLKNQYILVDGRFSSYDKDGATVFGIKASKGDLHRLPEQVAEALMGQGWNEVAKLSGKIENSKSNSEGEHFIKLGIRYMKPKDNDFGTYFVRVACPEEFQPEKYQIGSYVVVVGRMGIAQDGKPIVKAIYCG